MRVSPWCLGALGLIATACGLPSSHAAPALPAPGHAQVAPLPRHDGLQYCINLRARDLAPPGSRNVFVHSLSAYLTTNDPNEPAYLALTGRYPGWDTQGTTIYNQPFTNTNTVWLEIIHEFPLGIACIEAYGHGLLPSRYARFDYHMFVSFSYLPRRGPGTSSTKLFKVSWGQYLPQFSPRHRPKH